MTRLRRLRLHASNHASNRVNVHVARGNRRACAVVLAVLVAPASSQNATQAPRALRLRGEFDVGVGGTVSTLAFSDDGRLLAAASDVGEVVVSRVDTGELVVRLLAARETPTLAFSPNGDRLAAVGGRDLRVFTIPGGEVVAAREVFYGSPVAWSHRGETLVVQTTTDSIALLASEDLIEHQRIPLGGGGQLSALTLARDGQSVSFVQFRRGLFTVDLQSGEERLRAEGVLAGAVSFDGDRWLVAREGRSPLAPAPGIEDLGRARSLVAARDADQFLVRGREVVWRTHDGKVLCTLPGAEAVTLRPSGDLAAVARRGTIQLVAPDGSVVRELRGHRARPHQVVIAGDQRSVVATKSPHAVPVTGPNVIVYDVPTGERHAVTITPSPRALRASAGSPNVLFTGERNLLWDPRAKSATFDLGAGQLPSSPAWSPDARWIWTGRPRSVAPRGEIDTVFDQSSCDQRSLATPRGSEPLAWRHDGDALVLTRPVADSFGGGMGELFLTVGGKMRATVSLRFLVYEAVWSPDGRSIALTTSGGILIVDGETLATKAEGPRGSAWVRFLDADHVVCSADNRVTVLRTDSGEIVVTQALRAGLHHRSTQQPGLLGPPGDASADGRIVVAADGVGVVVFEVIR